MRCLVLLLKVQLLGLFGINKRLHEDGRKTKWVLAVICVAAAFVGAAIIAYMACLAQSMLSLELGAYIPLLGMTVIVMATIISTFTKANGTLFSLKDYDLVMSLPVPVSTVVLSRLIPLYGLSVLFGIMAMAPMLIVYALHVPMPAVAIPFSAAVMLLAPVIPMAAAVLLAALIALASARFRRANLLMSCLLMAALVALVMASVAFSSNPDSLDGMGAQVFSSLEGAYPPAAWAAHAIIAGDMPAFLGFAGLSVGVGLVVIVALTRLFAPVNQRLAASSPRASVSRAVASKPRTPLRALLAKEGRLLTATPIYFLNTCMGFALALVAGVAAVVLAASGTMPLDALPAELRPLVAPFLPWPLAFMLSIASTTAASVSLEGKAHWLMLTAPVSASVLLGSKLVFGLLIAVPAALVSSALVAVAFGLDVSSAAVLVLCAVSAACLSATMGLALDAGRPSFDWTSPYEPVKRGIPVVVTVLGGTAFTVLGCTGTALFGQVGTVAMAVVGLVVSGALWGRTMNASIIR